MIGKMALQQDVQASCQCGQRECQTERTSIRRALDPTWLIWGAIGTIAPSGPGCVGRTGDSGGLEAETSEGLSSLSCLSRPSIVHPVLFLAFSSSHLPLSVAPRAFVRLKWHRGPKTPSPSIRPTLNDLAGSSFALFHLSSSPRPSHLPSTSPSTSR